MAHRKFSIVLASSALALATPAAAASLVFGFEGSNQLQACALNACFRPPDTMGAVGTTQYVELNNGVFTVHNKTNGAITQQLSPNQFWTNAGLSTTGGDPRILFDPISQRWVASAFGSTGNVINIAVSATSDALGLWRGSSFQMIAPGGTADYPTLALDRDAVYIGTNNFTPSFSGTSLAVFSRNDIISGAAPITSGGTIFNTPLASPDRGFAIQGVNSTDNDGVGRIVADSRDVSGSLGYNITNPGSSTRAQTGTVSFNPYPGSALPDGRQPDGTRLVDTLDPRISGSAWEMNGKIYFAHTVPGTGANAGSSVVRVVVIDSVTKAVLSTTEIGSANYDYFQGSLAINNMGKLVVGYNRSGFSTADGQISIFARVFNANNDGTLTQTDEIFIRKSDTNSYRCGDVTPGAPIDTTCRQRWGDYSAVSLDPSDNNKFWVIGQYGLQNQIIPGFTTTQRSIWGTYIGVIDVSQGVPEPSTWAMMILGFGVVGASMRRRVRVSFA